MDRNRLIGNNNQLPWHLPVDFAHFKSVTMGKPIIMGRKTFESIGKPLPGRRNIVLSRAAGLAIEGVDVVTSLDEARSIVGDGDELMVIGGSTIYQLVLAEAQRMYLTHVEAEFEGDAWFPEFDMSLWSVQDETISEIDEKNLHRCRFVTYEKIS